MFFIIIILFALIIIPIGTEYIRTYRPSASQQKIPDSGGNLLPFRKKYILTKAEYKFFHTLRLLCNDKGFIICPKIGLKDLFEVADAGKNQYMRWFGKISQKHVDFIICDAELRPLFAIELDDGSHRKPEAQKNDEFKNRLFLQCKIPLYRIPANREYSAEYIRRYVTVL